MENIDDYTLQFAIVGLINGLVHLIILIASIIIFIKKRSIASILLLLGSFLISIGYVGGFIFNSMASKNGHEALVDSQITLTYFNAFGFSIFGVGLLILAIKKSKVSSIKTVDR